MTSNATLPSPHELAIVRTLRAMLEDALHRSDHDVAREIAAQIEDEIRRQGGRAATRR